MKGTVTSAVDNAPLPGVSVGVKGTATGAVTDVSGNYSLRVPDENAVLGVEAPANDGLSMLPTMLGKPRQQKKHDYLYFEYPDKGGQVAIRMGDWKGIKVGLRKNANIPWQLYNLKANIGEQNDVVARHPGIITQMMAIAQKEHRCSYLKEWEFVDPKFMLK